MLSPQMMKLMINFVEVNGYAEANGIDSEEENWKGYFYAALLLGEFY